LVLFHYTGANLAKQFIGRFFGDSTQSADKNQNGGDLLSKCGGKRLPVSIFRFTLVASFLATYRLRWYNEKVPFQF